LSKQTTEPVYYRMRVTECVSWSQDKMLCPRETLTLFYLR